MYEESMNTVLVQVGSSVIKGWKMMNLDEAVGP